LRSVSDNNDVLKILLKLSDTVDSKWNCQTNTFSIEMKLKVKIGEKKIRQSAKEN
jgi:hypothetical protein